MLIYESEDHPFWIQYPGGCHSVKEGEDGWLVNDLGCTLDTLISVSIKTWPENPAWDEDFALWVDRAAEDWGKDPDNYNVRRDSVTTHQGLTVELIRYEFQYNDGKPGTSTSAFYRHDDGSLFRIGMHYQTCNLKRDPGPTPTSSWMTFPGGSPVSTPEPPVECPRDVAEAKSKNTNVVNFSLKSFTVLE